jgi:tetratricopeptide (TPR) repeat protein
MSEQGPKGVAKFCAQCGATLPAGARFCAGCGRALAAPLAAAGARGLREQAPGLVVLTLFLAVGLGIWVSVLRPAAGPAGPLAGAGRPAPPTQGAGNVPPDHPPLTLPDEGKKFIASLVAKAEAAPADVGAWRTLAQVQARASEIDATYGQRAIDSYKHVLSLAPGDPEATRSLGNLYYDQQNYTASAEQYEKFLEANPGDPNVRTDLATTYLYQRQIDRAIDTYGKVLAANPEFLQAHFNLGLAYEAKGEREKALASLAKARSLATDEPTRSQIDRVTAQLKGEAPPLAAAGGGQAPPGGAGAGAPGPATGGGAAKPPMAPGSAAPKPPAAPAAADFKGEVEAALRAHQILGPKITAIEWPAATQARVLVANFPMQAMPEFARNLFRARLETILDDAKTKHGEKGETAIEVVDAASGASMDRVVH